MKVCIATSREIGERCITWAKQNLSEDDQIIENPEEADIFISVMYEKLLSEAFIEKRRCYNFHPGILPQYRGSGSFSWAILNGDHHFGVTLHEMDKSIDHGAIIAMKTAQIGDDDTAYSLYLKGMDMMYELFQEYFFQILANNYKVKEQQETNARIYYRKDLKKAMDLTKFARAFYFLGKEPAFWRDDKGNKHYLMYETS